MSFGNVYGVDLGTSSVKIFSLKKNKITVEKSMLAIRNQDQLLAVGNDAYEMFEKTPENVQISCPVAYGAIADVNHVEVVLHTLLRKTDRYIGHGPVIYFSVPMNMSEIERRAYYAITHNGLLHKPQVYLVERPVCDALALGIPISKTKGSMVVNIGAESTDFSIIANEQVIISKTIYFGGKQLNESICDMVRRNYNLLIGRRTARRLKIAMANLNGDRREGRKVVGINTLSGIPREGVVSAALVREAIREPLENIASELKTFIERIPPQIAASVAAEGIYLTGGTTRIPGLDKYIESFTGYPIKLSSYYELCTIKGLEELITHKALKKWARSIKEKK
ncbi:MAG: rod shape-determining protein [Lachnospiraceae bacterium]|nr:rod shape-determining protein [Lachnospiraceae bacterium]